MKRLKIPHIFNAIAALFVVFALAPAVAHAHEEEAGNLVFKHPFARASAGPAKAGAAFMGIHNNGDSADRLVDVSVSADVAKRAAIHTHIMENDIAKMRKVDGGVEIPAHGMAVLQPGGLHIMLMKLKAPLEEGESFMLTLEFEHAGEVMIEIPILGVGAQPETDGMDHSNMNMDQ